MTPFTQLGALFPLFRNRAATPARRRSRGAGQPYQAFIRQAIGYATAAALLLTLADEAARTGAPITRPMLYHWPE